MEIVLPKDWIQVVTNDNIPLYWSLSEEIFTFSVPLSIEYLEIMYRHFFNKNLSHSISAIKHQLKEYRENKGI